MVYMKGKKKKLCLLNERDKEDYHILCTPNHSNIIILKEILFIELNIELYSIIMYETYLSINILCTMK